MTEASSASEDRWVPLRAFVAGALLLAGGAALARGVAAAVIKASPPVLEDYAASVKRLVQFNAALPAIAARDEGQQGFVLGSSLAFFAYSPQRVDAELASRGVELTSYSSASAAVSPTVQLLIARRIREAYERQHKRVFLSLVEFTPHSMTTTTLAFAPFHKVELHGQAEFLDLRALLDLADRAPDDAAHVVALKVLGNPDTTKINDELAKVLLTPPGEKKGRGGRGALLRGLDEVNGGLYPAWNEKVRGEPRWLHPTTQAPYFGLVRSFEAGKPRHRARLVMQNDALGLHMSARRVEEFIDEVREMQAISDHTYIWLAPRNTQLLMPTRDGLRRLAEAVEYVARETGAPVIDLTTAPGIGPADFIDASHLSEHAGRPKFAEAFGARIAEELEREERGEPAEPVDMMPPEESAADARALLAQPCAGGSVDAGALLELRGARGDVVDCRVLPRHAPVRRPPASVKQRARAQHREEDPADPLGDVAEVEAAGTTSVTLRYVTERDSLSRSRRALGTAVISIPAAVSHPGTVLVVGHQTVGIGPGCAPSRQPLGGQGRTFAHDGWLTIVPDSAGYRAEDWPPVWMSAEDEARSLFDAVRAATHLLAEPNKPKQVLLYGFSQGGHAALAAQALARADGFTIPIVGVAAVAPMWFPPELFGRLAHAEPSESAGQRDRMWALFYFFGHGAQFDPPEEALLPFAPDRRASLRASVHDDCSKDVAGALRIDDGALFEPDFVRSLEACESGAACEGAGKVWKDRFARDRPKLDPAGAPVFYYQGMHDTNVLPPRARCGIDQAKRTAGAAKLTICVDPRAAHYDAGARSFARVKAWLEDRASGKPRSPTMQGCVGEEMLPACDLPDD